MRGERSARRRRSEGLESRLSHERRRAYQGRAHLRRKRRRRPAGGVLPLAQARQPGPHPVARRRRRSCKEAAGPRAAAGGRRAAAGGVEGEEGGQEGVAAAGNCRLYDIIYTG